MKVRKSISMSLVAALVLGCIAMLLVEAVPPIPPHSMTHMSMSMCKRRILRYAQKHGELPAALTETEEIEGFHASITDGWGVVLQYSADANDIVTFRSLGKDRAPGGVGDNVDMIGIFPARKADVSWSGEFVPWTQDPFDTLRQERPNQYLGRTR
jgi:hypothetical protein